MQKVTNTQVEQPGLTEPEGKKGYPRIAVKNTARWLAMTLAPPDGTANRPSHTKIIIAFAFAFALALGVRLLHLQDRRVAIEQGEGWFTELVKPYQKEAKRMVEQGAILFPTEAIEPGDTRMLVHPPGYSILLAAVYGRSINQRDLPAVRSLQIIVDAIAAAAVLFIATQLLPFPAAILASILVAISPHFSYNVLRLTPDSISVLPILMAVYFVIRAVKQPRIMTALAAGASVGLSCWFRSNSMLLAPLLAVVMALLLARGVRLRYSLALIAASIIVVSPITIRNWVVFHRFIPLTLPMGINLLQGIAEHDTDGRFGLPTQDWQLQLKEAEWHGRPDYEESLWRPDGFEREQERLNRALAIVRSNPVWFLKTMFSRLEFMLSYNDSRRHDWPTNTALAPVISGEPPFGHSLGDEGGEIWSASPAELIASVEVVSQQATISLADDSRALQVTSNDSEFGDQLATAPIIVKKNTDYVLTFAARPMSGHLAAKVTSSDRRVTLASDQLKTRKRSKKKSEAEIAEAYSLGLSDDQPVALIKLPFSSGNRTEVRLVVSNDGRSPAPPTAQISQVIVTESGPTPLSALIYPRVLIGRIQKRLFTTSVMRLLIIIGVVLLWWARSGRALVLLLAVPIYFLLLHAPFSTEYRYVLAIHYFLFILASVTLFCAGKITREGAQLLMKRTVGPLTQSPRLRARG